MKNNRGFIATSVLFGIVALLFITIVIILGNSQASLKNSKIYGSMLKAEISDLAGIKLDPTGGTLKKDYFEIDDNGRYSKLSEKEYEPKKTGYTFLRWCTTKTGCPESTSSGVVDSTSQYADVLANKLYAVWEIKSFNLTIKPEGGTYNGILGDMTVILKYGETYNLVEPTRVGYIFKGWILEGSGSSFNESIFKMGSENATLTAIWEKKTVHLSIDPDGGCFNGILSETCDSQKVNIDLKYQDTYKDLKAPEKDGYTFAGWEFICEEKTCESNPANLEYNNETKKYEVTIFENDVYLKATWLINQYRYTIKHHQQNLSNPLEFTEVEIVPDDGGIADFGSRIDPIFKNFTGFSQLPEKTDPPYIIITTDIEENNINCYYSRNSYKLTLNLDGGYYDDDIIEYDLLFEESKTLTNPKKTGYTFINWTSDICVTGDNCILSNGKLNDGELKDNEFTMGTDDILLQATWVPNEYKVSFNTNGGNNIPDKIVTYDSPYGDLDEPIRDGYTFKGWYLYANGYKTKIDEDTIVDTPEDHTLYAEWTPNQYKVTLHSRRGADGTLNDTTSEITVTYDSTYNNLPTLEDITGHSFYGWFKNNDPIDINRVNQSDKVLITEDMDLYAYWIPNDAAFINYSNTTYTTCTTVACALDELYEKFK